MAAQADFDGWKERMEAIRQRLLHPRGLDFEERSALKSEFKAIEKLAQAPPRPSQND